MDLSQDNTNSVQALISLGLFQTKEEVINYTTSYALNVDSDSYIEETFELDMKSFDYLKEMSEKTGASIGFLINKILQRYIHKSES